MIPNIYIHERLVLERLQHLQREAELKRMLVNLPRQPLLRHLLGYLGTCFMALGTRMQQLERGDQPTVCNGTREGAPCRKDKSMNPQFPASEQIIIATPVETDAPERGGLAECGFTAEEIVALLWLRHWYQTGGSDRMEIVRHWEFLKWLVMTGKLEV
jgi:hypothetical protein